MKLSLTIDCLTDYLQRQVNTFFPDKEVSTLTLSPIVKLALERFEMCFSGVRWKYYYEDGNVVFDHLNTDHYAQFLYFGSCSASKRDDCGTLSAKLYALNKALHGVDIHFEAGLPDKFLLVHPVGSVLGRAVYGNFFIAYQGCTVGSNIEGGSPVIGEGVALFGGSRVIGKSHVGNNCMISAGTLILNSDIPENTVAFMEDGRLNKKSTTYNVSKHVFFGVPR